MSDTQDTTLLVLADGPVQLRVASALQSAAQALGYASGCYIAQLDRIDDLRLFVFENDPWCVMALDDASTAALCAAFNLTAEQFAADLPAQACGYCLVAVPGFSECLDNSSAKRVAWHRMQAAAHPGNPLD